MSFLSTLTIVFIVFKLLGHIDWSWWLVLSPTLGEIMLVVVLVVTEDYREIIDVFLRRGKGRR